MICPSTATPLKFKLVWPTNSAMAVTVAPPSPFLPINSAGGNEGNEFDFMDTNGAILEKIGVWVGKLKVNAVKIWLTDGKARVFGTPSDNYKEYSFQPGETISSMSLWGDTHLHAIKFNTNKENGKEFFAGITTGRQKQKYPTDTGSGICVGVKGRARSGIIKMGFLFVKPIRKSVMSNIEYPTLGLDAVNVPISA